MDWNGLNGIGLDLDIVDKCSANAKTGNAKDLECPLSE